MPAETGVCRRRAGGRLCGLFERGAHQRQPHRHEICHAGSGSRVPPAGKRHRKAACTRQNGGALSRPVRAKLAVSRIARHPQHPPRVQMGADSRHDLYRLGAIRVQRADALDDCPPRHGRRQPAPRPRIYAHRVSETRRQNHVRPFEQRVLGGRIARRKPACTPETARPRAGD